MPPGAFRITQLARSAEQGDPSPLADSPRSTGLTIRVTRVAVRWLPWVIIGVGVALRLNQLLSGRAFWADEAWVAILVTERSYQQFFAPLGVGMATPPLILAATKALSQVLGTSELVMRSIPFAAGVLALPVFFRFAKQHVSSGAALVGLISLAVSTHLVYYAGELKQYSTDLFVGALLMSILLQRGALDMRRSLGLAIACALAIWFSHPSVFLIFGYTFSSALVFWTRGDRKSATMVIPIIAASSLSFLLLFISSISSSSNSPYLLGYWRNYFAPFPIDSFKDAYWFYRTAMYTIDDPMGLVEPRPAAVLILVGTLALVRSKPAVALRLLSPLPLLVAASMLHKYPLNGRLLLFLTPTIALLLGVGVDWIARFARRGYAAVWVALVVVAILLPGLPTTWRKAQAPRFRTELRPILEEVRSRWRPGDAIYSYGGWGAAHLYYAKQLDFPLDARIPRSDSTEHSFRMGPGDPNMNLTQAQAFDRVWVIVPISQRESALDALTPLGEPTQTFQAYGTEALLYLPP